MTVIPYAFKKFLFKNTKYNKGTKYKSKDIIRAVILSLYDINPAQTLGIKKQNLSIMFKKAYGHLMAHKPLNVPVPKYLLFIAGFKRCKINKEIYPLNCFEPDSTTWDGYRDYTVKSRSEMYFNNKAKVQEYRQWYQKQNSDIIASISAKRRASLLGATPKWLTEEHYASIRKIYNEAKRITQESGEAHHVDHIVPLQGKTVCGLHVPWNLQILSANKNITKSNKFIGELS